MKKYATTWLLIVSIIIAESWSYLPTKYAIVKQNWIWTIDRAMELQWNVKYLSLEVNAILYFFAMFFYNRNRVNKATVITFIALCFIDLGMYIHNYKTLHYGSVYVWVAGIWFFVFYRRPLLKTVKCKIVLLCQHTLKIIEKIKRKLKSVGSQRTLNE